MKKAFYIILALLVSMVLESCDCGCDVEPIELKSPEVQVYRLYSSNNSDYNSLYVYKYDTPDAYIYRFTISGETRNVNIVPKNQYVNPLQDTESILNKDTYFDY